MDYSDQPEEGIGARGWVGALWLNSPAAEPSIFITRLQGPPRGSLVTTVSQEDAEL